MKKFLVVLALISVFTVSVFAQGQETVNAKGRDESKWSTLSYVNVPVLRVFDARDGYLVVYEKDSSGVGSVVIPKSWIRGTVENPRKLKVRDVNTAKEAYMSIVKENGTFKRVVLNLPKSRTSYIWAVAENGTVLEGTDKETLEELDL